MRLESSTSILLVDNWISGLMDEHEHTLTSLDGHIGLIGLIGLIYPIIG